jgi:hypothetical protein
MSMNREVNKSEYEYLNKMFMGVVEDINDPRKEGRCRVRVISIHEDSIPTEDLPWAYPSQKSTVFGKGGAGSISIPKKGAMVIIKFNNGNIYSPEYLSIHELAQDVKDELNSEYEGSHILLFDGDQELKIWFAPSKGITISVKGSSINLAPDNTVTIKTDNKVVVDAKRVELGAGAAEAVIKGDTFLNLFNAHVHPSAGAPPAVQLPGSTVLSKFIKTK